MPGTPLLTRLREHPRWVFAAAWAVVGAYRFLIWSVYLRLVPFTGDEVFYSRGARTIHRWLRGVEDWDRVVDRVVTKGWFMPGITLHLLPARRLTDDVGLLRLWLGVIDLALLAVLVVLVGRLLGRRVALGALLVIGIMPTMAAQSFSVWGEAHGSKTLLIAFFLLLITIDRASAWSTTRIVLACGTVGLVLGWSVYLRPPFLLQIGTAVVCLAALTLGSLRPLPRRTLVIGAVLIPVTASLLITPWSIVLSDRSGGFVLTTNTVNVNLIQAFADPEDLDERMGGDTFGQLETYIRERMVVENESYVEALANTRRELFESVTLGEYLNRADNEITTYLDVTEAFLVRYNSLSDVRTAEGLDPPPKLGPDVLRVLNVAMWIPLALGALYGLLRPSPLSSAHGFTGLLARIAVPAAMIQPWISNAKFRHLGAILPLLTLVALATIFDRSTAADDEVRFTLALRRFGQVVYGISAGFILITLTVYLT